MSKISGSPFSAELYPYAVVVDRESRHLYVANNASGNISAYTIDPRNGSLQRLADSPFAADLGPYALAISELM